MESLLNTTGRRRVFTALLAGAAGTAGLGVFGRARAAMDGIKALIAVTQMKADQANDEALAAATTARSLVARQRAKRAMSIGELEAHSKQLDALVEHLKAVGTDLGKLRAESEKGC